MVEEVVLHHPQLAAALVRGVDHPSCARQIVRHGLLHIDVPPASQALHDARLVRRDWQQHLDGVDGESTGREFLDGRERPRVGPIELALRSSFVARIHQGDDLGVLVVDVGAHVQVVDPSEPDDRDAHATLEGREI